LIKAKAVSLGMADKCAESGIGLHHLQLVFQRSDVEWVKMCADGKI